MAEELPIPDTSGQNRNLRLVVLGLFFGGLFLLAVGGGFYFFGKGNTSSDEIQIISAGEKVASGSEIMVHVDGAVVSPGVYKLAQGARINDCVSAAGGFSPQADQSKVNLAAKVTDGQKIHIQQVGESVSQSVSGSVSQVAGESASQLININTASKSELDKLPGVGPVTAQKIIASRPYSASEDLLTKKVVSASVYGKIKDLITY